MSKKRDSQRHGFGDLFIAHYSHRISGKHKASLNSHLAVNHYYQYRQKFGQPRQT